MPLEPGHEALKNDHTHYNRAHLLRATYAGTNAIKSLYNLIRISSYQAIHISSFASIFKLYASPKQNSLPCEKLCFESCIPTTVPNTPTPGQPLEANYSAPYPVAAHHH